MSKTEKSEAQRMVIHALIFSPYKYIGASLIRQFMGTHYFSIGVEKYQVYIAWSSDVQHKRYSVFQCQAAGAYS